MGSIYSEFWHMLVVDFTMPTIEAARVEGFRSTMVEGLNDRLESIINQLSKYSPRFDCHQAVTYDKDESRFKLPQLTLKLANQEIDVCAQITPCIGGSSHTKLLIIPHLTTHWQDENPLKMVEAFFDECKKMSDSACNAIGREYLNLLASWDTTLQESIGSFDNIGKYKLQAFAIGSDLAPFKELIENADDATEMARIIKNSNNIKNVIKLLQYVRLQPGEEENYKWFKEERNRKAGLFSFATTEEEGNYIAITSENPHSLVKGVFDDAIRLI